MRRASRIPELDGLRGFAILAVLLFHFSPATGPLRVLAPALRVGWVGVDLFFVLSGYLITGILVDSVGRARYYRNFMIRRSLRIFPLYYACLALYCALTYYPYPIDWRDFLRQAGWYFGYAGNFKVVAENAWPKMAHLTPLWSLQVEEQFYLTYPLFVWALSRRRLALFLAGAAALAPAIRVALLIAAPGNRFGPYALAPCRMDSLALGGLIAVAQREWPELLKLRWIGRAAIAGAAVFVCICIFVSNEPWSVPMQTAGYTAAAICFAGLLAALIARRPRRLIAICRIRVFVWMGTVSYGLYLLHIPARTIVHRLLDSSIHVPVLSSADLFLSLVSAILLASFSWKVFESPILRLKNRFTSDR